MYRYREYVYITYFLCNYRIAIFSVRSSMNALRKSRRELISMVGWFSRKLCISWFLRFSRVHISSNSHSHFFITLYHPSSYPRYRRHIIAKVRSYRASIVCDAPDISFLSRLIWDNRAIVTRNIISRSLIQRNIRRRAYRQFDTRGFSLHGL